MSEYKVGMVLKAKEDRYLNDLIENGRYITKGLLYQISEVDINTFTFIDDFKTEHTYDFNIADEHFVKETKEEYGSRMVEELKKPMTEVELEKCLDLLEKEGVEIKPNTILKKCIDERRKKEVGTKLDKGKLRYDLIAPEALKEFARVLTWGAYKYAPNNWKKVESPQERYYAALMRHLEAYRLGELENHEEHKGKKFTGHHLSSVLCCAYFLLQLDIENEEYIIPDNIFDEDNN